MKREILKACFLLVLVAAVSVCTTLLMQNNLQTDLVFNTSDNNVKPVGYAKFVNATSGIETDFTIAAELSVNAVVHVKTKYPSRQQMYSTDPFLEWFFGRPQQTPRNMPEQEGSGSGVIISPDGYIVTNNHVIDKSNEIEIVLNDKRTFKATLVGTDPNTDLALLKVEATELPIIVFGNSDLLKVGEWVLAVGNPFNLTSTVTAGIVSAKARNINIINAEMKIESFIQTDAAVNPGNSGGALVNTRGELIGINTAIASQTGSYAGYAFAVPSSIVQKVVSDLKQYGVVQRALLGIGLNDITPKLAEEKKLKTLTGVYVSSVLEFSSAAEAGIKEGDIVTHVNDIDVKTATELQEQIARYRPGDKISIRIARNDKLQDLTVILKNKQGTTDVVKNVTNSIEALGAQFEPISEKLKHSLSISYGLRVKDVKQGMLQKAGVNSGFIILKINNRPITSETDLQAAYHTALNSNEREKVLFVAGVYPNGRVAYYAVNLAE